MNLILFGATGRTGQQLLAQALEQGHHVTAFVRDPAKISIQHSHPRVIQGDVTDSLAVERAVAGQEVVLSALGSGAGQPLSVRSEGVRQIVRAMEKQRVHRIIAVLSRGVLTDVVAPQFAELVQEHRRVLTVLQASATDWIAVCPPLLITEPGQGKVRAVAGAVVEDGPTITYADLAMFMLQQLSSPRYVHQAVGVAN